MAGLAPGKHEGGGHAFQVPLEWTANGLVKIVDVEDEAAVGRGISAEIADVGVAAELRDDARIRQHGEVCGHDWCCAAKISRMATAS